MIENSQNKYKEIVILPDFIANQIAAGEVVQQPESVVKELVENSLDSGADSIVVVVKGAGKQLIHVVDNGTGMSRHDLELACKRHATSKILSQEDLEEINTYGFRGEALASISSVAGLEIRTRRQSEEHGWRLIAEPMKEHIIEPYNSDYGTQIFVRNLFYNVPARRKFLKSNLTEFRYISDTMIKFALSHPEIRFTFYDEDTLIFDVKPSALEKRISEVIGANTANSIIPVHIENEYVQISGFVGQPHIAKQSRSGQYLFLNNRSIKSKSLSHAVFSAFEHLLEKSANPFFVINIKIDPKNVDVNVHPQKHEVKFEDERIIYNLINRAVNQALQEHNLAPEVKINEQFSQTPFEKIPSGNDDSSLILVNKITGEIIENKVKHINKNEGSFRPDSYSSGSRGSSLQYNSERESSPRPTQKEISSFEALFGLNVKEEDNKEEIDVNISGKTYYYFWQAHNKYIFLQTEKGITVIDQHAAHERILYEKAIDAMNKHFANTQDLLFPVSFNLNTSEIAIVREIEDDLGLLGYIFNINESNEITISGAPLDVIDDGEEEKSFRSIIEEYDENKKIRHTNKRDNLAASFSCKAAIKTGQKLSGEEIKKLLNDLFQCKNPYSCPHGRPIVIEFSLQEFDKMFGRI